MLQVQAWILIYTHTRGSEEGPRQPVVGGDLPDVCGDVDESTDHWRDPVKAQQSETHTQTFRERKGQERERASARAKDTRAPFFFSIYILLESMIQAVRQRHE